MKYLIALLVFVSVAQAQNRPWYKPANNVSGAITTPITNTTSTQAIASGGAGVRNYVCGWAISNSAAAVDTWVELLDGGTILDYQYCRANTGQCITRSYSPCLRGSPATAVNVRAVTTSANLGGSVVGYRESD